MRGGDERSGSLFSYVGLEGRVDNDHPLRAIRGIVNEALAGLSGAFSALYSRSGRPSIPPEKLLRAMLLQAFYSIRSERQLMERLEFDLLFRWFVGIGVDDAAWDHSTFSKNRERLLGVIGGSRNRAEDFGTETNLWTGFLDGFWADFDAREPESTTVWGRFHKLLFSQRNPPSVGFGTFSLLTPSARLAVPRRANVGGNPRR
jgi:hypothetical protein